MAGDRAAATPPAESEHLDVLVVGAGLSGIGAACRLLERCPGKRIALVEARAAIGGTWDLFRYPGIRSDSDMFTLGYPFRPWPGTEAIAAGPRIRDYIRETARDRGVEELIRFHRRVVRASWSSADARWTVEIERTDGGGREQLTCGFLYACTGYYRYDRGYTPELPGIERFAGPVIHPQDWPEDLGCDGVRFAVVGSGATAYTLVPALAERGARVTMIQRSPSYVVSLPRRDPLARLLSRVAPPRLRAAVVRWKNVLLALGFYQLSRRRPRAARALIRRGVERRLPPGHQADPDFTPRYDPWDQRVCLVPDGDFFAALASGRAAVVTERIEGFDAGAVELASGRRVEADVVVTATGLELLVLGGIELEVDGEPASPAGRVAYKGMMLSGIPNLALALGYTNASWTLKADLIARFVCRLLNHMDAHGYAEARPRPPAAGTRTEPIIGLTSGYVLRALERLPLQGERPPWRLHQSYPLDLLLLRHGRLEDGVLELRAAGPRRPAPATDPAPAPATTGA